MLKAYIERAQNEACVTFVGRLGSYQYIDMDVTIREALNAADLLVKTSDTAPMPAFVKVAL